MRSSSVLVRLPLICLIFAGGAAAQNLFDLPAPGVETRWLSFENRSGGKGQGGLANQGRKGAASTRVKAGETFTMVDVRGPAVIRRIWITVRGNVENLRGLVIRAYWDGSDIPSVEAPLQDFFGIPLGRQVPFQSVFFSNPEGRSFNCFIPMPFKSRGVITIENQSPKDCEALFYEVDCTVGDRLPDGLAYFHARYRRQNPTVPKKDFEILPQVNGKRPLPRLQRRHPSGRELRRTVLVRRRRDEGLPGR